MTIPAPRELLAVLVEVEPSGITATFDLGEPYPLDRPAEWFTYGLALLGEDDGLVKHFAARFSPAETKAFIFEFESATQANYDSSHVDDNGSSVVVRFPDSSLGTENIVAVSGFGTVDGEDVSVDVPVQLLR